MPDTVPISKKSASELTEKIPVNQKTADLILLELQKLNSQFKTKETSKSWGRAMLEEFQNSSKILTKNQQELLGSSNPNKKPKKLERLDSIASKVDKNAIDKTTNKIEGLTGILLKSYRDVKEEIQKKQDQNYGWLDSITHGATNWVGKKLSDGVRKLVKKDDSEEKESRLETNKVPNVSINPITETSKLEQNKNSLGEDYTNLKSGKTGFLDSIVGKALKKLSETSDKKKEVSSTTEKSELEQNEGPTDVNIVNFSELEKKLNPTFQSLAKEMSKLNKNVSSLSNSNSKPTSPANEEGGGMEKVTGVAKGVAAARGGSMVAKLATNPWVLGAAAVGAAAAGTHMASRKALDVAEKATGKKAEEIQTPKEQIGVELANEIAKRSIPGGALLGDSAKRIINSLYLANEKRKQNKGLPSKLDDTSSPKQELTKLDEPSSPTNEEPTQILPTKQGESPSPTNEETTEIPPTKQSTEKTEEPPPSVPPSADKEKDEATEPSVKTKDDTTKESNSGTTKPPAKFEEVVKQVNPNNNLTESLLKDLTKTNVPKAPNIIPEPVKEAVEVTKPVNGVDSAKESSSLEKYNAKEQLGFVPTANAETNKEETPVPSFTNEPQPSSQLEKPKAAEDNEIDQQTKNNISEEPVLGSDEIPMKFEEIAELLTKNNNLVESILKEITKDKKSSLPSIVPEPVKEAAADLGPAGEIGPEGEAGDTNTTEPSSQPTAIADTKEPANIIAPETSSQPTAIADTKEPAAVVNTPVKKEPSSQLGTDVKTQPVAVTNTKETAEAIADAVDEKQEKKANKTKSLKEKIQEKTDQKYGWLDSITHGAASWVGDKLAGVASKAANTKIGKKLANSSVGKLVGADKFVDRGDGNIEAKASDKPEHHSRSQKRDKKGRFVKESKEKEAAIGSPKTEETNEAFKILKARANLGEQKIPNLEEIVTHLNKNNNLVESLLNKITENETSKIQNFEKPLLSKIDDLIKITKNNKSVSEDKDTENQNTADKDTADKGQQQAETNNVPAIVSEPIKAVVNEPKQSTQVVSESSKTSSVEQPKPQPEEQSTADQKINKSSSSNVTIQEKEPTSVPAVVPNSIKAAVDESSKPSQQSVRVDSAPSTSKSTTPSIVSKEIKQAVDQPRIVKGVNRDPNAGPTIVSGPLKKVIDNETSSSSTEKKSNASVSSADKKVSSSQLDSETKAQPVVISNTKEVAEAIADKQEDKEKKVNKTKSLKEEIQAKKDQNYGWLDSITHGAASWVGNKIAGGARSLAGKAANGARSSASWAANTKFGKKLANSPVGKLVGADKFVDRGDGNIEAKASDKPEHHSRSQKRDEKGRFVKESKDSAKTPKIVSEETKKAVSDTDKGVDDESESSSRESKKEDKQKDKKADSKKEGKQKDKKGAKKESAKGKPGSKTASKGKKRGSGRKGKGKGKFGLLKTAGLAAGGLALAGGAAVAAGAIGGGGGGEGAAPEVVPTSVKDLVVDQAKDAAVDAATYKVTDKATDVAKKKLTGETTEAAGKKVGAEAAEGAAKTAGKKVAAEGAEAAGKAGAKAASKAGAKAAAKAGAKAGGKAGIMAAIKKLVPKALVKAAGKSIPFIGAAIGGVFAIGKLIKGDLAGAALEAGSGMGGPITAIPLTVASVARDIYEEVYDVTPEKDPEAGSRMSEIKDQATAFATDWLKGKQDPKAEEEQKKEENQDKKESTEAEAIADAAPAITPEPIKEAISTGDAGLSGEAGPLGDTGSSPSITPEPVKEAIEAATDTKYSGGGESFGNVSSDVKDTKYSGGGESFGNVSSIQGSGESSSSGTIKGQDSDTSSMSKTLEQIASNTKNTSEGIKAVADGILTLTKMMNTVSQKIISPNKQPETPSSVVSPSSAGSSETSGSAPASSPWISKFRSEIVEAARFKAS